MKWVSYWRKNPHRFVEDYIGLKLHFFQKLILYMFDRHQWNMFIAARGLGKSFITAVYCVVRCILYPGTRIIIASGTKGQARLVISEKVQWLYNNYYSVREEIGDPRNFKSSVNETSVTFKNGSKISAETASDNTRGFRANILIVDEFRMVKKDTIDSVLKPILSATRHLPFKSRPKYHNYPDEDNKEIYLSSAWYKVHWSWDEFKKYAKEFANGGDYFVLDAPYQLSVHHGLLPLSRVMADKESDTFDDAKFMMEYEGQFVGENERGYFKLDAINKCRKLNKTFIPPTNLEYIENASLPRPKKLGNMPRKRLEGEIRLVSLDIALMGGNKNVKNDTSAFTLVRLIQDGTTYHRDVVYLESIKKSIDSYDLAVRTKQLYYDFEADYVVMDTHGAGIGVFDACAKITIDEERDTEYEAWAAINDDEMNERIMTKGIPVIYSIKASANWNHECAVSLRSAFEKGRISLPMDDITRREQLVEKGGFLTKEPAEQQRELYTYQQATVLTNELVSLEYIMVAGNIKIQEVGSATKDRYSSLSYVNQIAVELEKELVREQKTKSIEDYLFINSYQ